MYVHVCVVFPVVEDQRSAEAGEAHTQEAKEEDTAAKEAGKSSEAQKTHGKCTHKGAVHMYEFCVCSCAMGKALISKGFI